MPDARQNEREQRQQSATSTAVDQGMAFRPADGGAAARGQSAEFLAAGGGEAAQAESQNASQAGAAASGGAQTEAGGEDARREAAARADWESFLGKAIGGKLFELVKAQVDPTQLTKYAEQGTSALAKEFGKLGDRAFKDDKGQAEALNGFLTALAPELKRLADQWLEGPDAQKILKGVSDWSEEHPRIVTSVLGAAIIGAAIAAYLSNMDPPALEKTFKLGRGFTAGGSVDFGPVQKLAIQAASISLGYESEKLTAMVSAKYTQSADGKSTTTIEGQAKGKLGENTTADGKASVSTTSDGQTTTSLEAGVESQMSKDSKANARGTLTMNPDGSAVLKVDTGLETTLGGRPASFGGGLRQTRGADGQTSREVNGRIKLGDDKQNVSTEGTFNPDTRAFSLSFNRTEMDGRLRQSATMGRDAQGQNTQSHALDFDVDDKQSFGHTRTEGPQGTSDAFRYRNSAVNGSNFGVNAQAQTGADKGFGLGVTFTEGDFKAALDYEMKAGVNRLGASASYSNSDGYTAGMDLKANLDAGRFDHFGFNLGWRDPKQFRSLMLKYDAEWDASNPGHKHQLDLTAETVLATVETRLSAKAKWDGKGNNGVDVGVMGAKPLNSDWRALGGIGYKGEDKDGQYKGSMYLQAGVQYKDVPIVLTFDPGEKKVMLGITIPFGR
jgi:hypothetical protein